MIQLMKTWNQQIDINFSSQYYSRKEAEVSREPQGWSQAEGKPLTLAQP